MRKLSINWKGFSCPCFHGFGNLMPVPVTEFAFRHPAGPHITRHRQVLLLKFPLLVCLTTDGLCIDCGFQQCALKAVMNHVLCYDKMRSFEVLSRNLSEGLRKNTSTLFQDGNTNDKDTSGVGRKKLLQFITVFANH